MSTNISTETTSTSISTEIISTDISLSQNNIYESNIKITCTDILSANIS
jgi:hypothetical protein